MPCNVGAAGTVVAEGQDRTQHHPLGHAIMVAIEAAAARDRQLWPVESPSIGSSELGLSNSPNMPSTATELHRRQHSGPAGVPGTEVVTGDQAFADRAGLIDRPQQRQADGVAQEAPAGAPSTPLDAALEALHCMSGCNNLMLVDDLEQLQRNHTGPLSSI